MAQRKSSSLRRVVAGVALLAGFGLTHATQAQSTEADIKARIIHKDLYLRGFWRDNKLKFDGAGNIQKTGKLTSFTVCGADLDEVSLKQDKLVLDGHRVALKFNKKGPIRVGLKIGPDSVEMEKLHIEIAAPPNGDYGQALNAIFADGLTDLAASLPQIWQPYARKNFSTSAPVIETDSPVNTRAAALAERPGTLQPMTVGGRVKAPRVLKSVEPRYVEEARMERMNASVLVNLIVDTNGNVQDPSILSPAGFGLDEAAVAAVQSYKFAPAMEGERPVPVQLTIEVDFQIF